jgi:Ser/Thr protein kinase RdoA (MazF antagonist)
MKKLWVFLLITCLAFSVVGPSRAAPFSQVDETALQIMTLINAYRAENGLYPYACSSILIGVAQAHSDYQASIDESTHVGAGGTHSSQRVEASGYGGDNAIQVDEMIYTGQFATPEKAVAWWKGSPIHNAIMLSDKYHEFGVGVAQSATNIFYTVNVASITGVTSPSPMGQPLSCDLAGIPAPSTDGTPDSQADPLSRIVETLSAIASNQWMMMAVGLVLLGVVGFLLVRQLRGRTDAEGLEEEQLLEERDEKDLLEITGSSSGETDTSFQRLSLKDQLYALEVLARKVLPAYPLEIVNVEPLRYALNAEFLITALAPGDSGPPKRYVLRVNAPGFHTEVEIRSELQWLLALNRATDLIVPNPVPTKSGEWVTSAEPPGIPVPRYCVLFEYIPGQAIESAISSENMEKVGVFIAKLHHHGALFTPPEGFTRKHWDLKGLSGGMLDVPVEEVYALLTDEERSVIKSAEDLVAEATERLGKGKEFYGLIHADLHNKSYLFRGEDAFVLDFDTCGYGYYIYDLAVPIWNLIDIKHDNIEALKSALFRGYRRVKTLSLAEEKLLRNFIAGRLMIHTLTLIAHREDPAIQKNAARAISRGFKLMRMIAGIR